MSVNITEIQKDLRGAKLDGWLFYDFRARDPIAHRLLHLPDGMRTRRWYYFVPAKGTPRKLVHKIETGALATLPGSTSYYSGHQELQTNLKKLLSGAKKIAMQYSPLNQIPYVAMVDAGTIEQVRKCGTKIFSSADLVQKYEACWTPEQLASHKKAGTAIDRIIADAFALAAKSVREKKTLTEYDLQQFIRQEFAKEGIVADDGPDVAVNAHASDPHYAPTPENSAPIREGDFLLLDVWGKTKDPHSVFYDISWVGYLGAKVPEKIAKVFAAVRDARDKAVDLIRTRIASGKPLQGWEVDKIARDHIEKSGFGKYFIHRTGHNIGETIHGNGANMDGLETHDVRQLIPRTCTSVEPGIYLKDFGIRSEVNMMTGDREAKVTGRLQTELVRV